MPLGKVATEIVTKLLDFIPDASRNTPNQAYADVIVAGGKGLKNADNFKLVCAWRRGWRDTRPYAGRMVRGRASGGPDRQDGAAHALHRRRHLRLKAFPAVIAPEALRRASRASCVGWPWPGSCISVDR
jgi:hypothetical protein